MISDSDVSRRELLRRILESDHAYDVIAEAGTGEECAGILASELPELAICSTAGTPQLAATQPALPVLITIAGRSVPSQRVLCDVAMPLCEAQLAEALTLATSRILQIKLGELSALLRAYLADAATSLPVAQEIEAADETGQLCRINTGDVLWIRSARNHVRLFTAAGAFEIRETIGNIAARLQPAGFRRIHRCVVVNDRAIRHRMSKEGVPTSVVLGDGTQLPVGPNFRDLSSWEGGELSA